MGNGRGGLEADMQSDRTSAGVLVRRGCCRGETERGGELGLALRRAGLRTSSLGRGPIGGLPNECASASEGRANARLVMVDGAWE